MNRIGARNAAAVLIFIYIAFLAIGVAFAHRVDVFAWVEGDTVYVESKFSGGKKVKSGKIVVMDPQGTEVLSGLTNDEGEFSFKIPKRTDLKIVLNAGEGHRGEWTVRAEEMPQSPAGTPLRTGAEKTGPAEQEKSAEKSSSAEATVMPDAKLRPRELEAVIDTALDQKLKPIIRMLADMQQEGPTAKDIFAGIGYIFGLVGIAAYAQSRKKKG